MRTLGILFGLFIFGTSSVFAATTLPEEKNAELLPDFRLKQFASCQEMRGELSKFLEIYYGKQ